MTAENRAQVVCVGNELVGDDAAGWAVYRRLRGRLPRGAKLHLLACGGLDLLRRLDGARSLVVVDAVRFGAPPGTVHVLDWNSLPAARGGAVSAHGIGVREALSAGALLAPEAMPTSVTLVGIEGECFDGLGSPLSPPVAAAVPRAGRAVLRIVRAALAPAGEV